MEETIQLTKEYKDKYRIDPLAEIKEPPAYCIINSAPSLPQVTSH